MLVVVDVDAAVQVVVVGLRRGRVVHYYDVGIHGEEMEGERPSIIWRVSARSVDLKKIRRGKENMPLV